MTKIVLTGPESTGKSYLAEKLATYFDIPWIEEYARTYLDQRNGKYEYEDLLQIATAQLQSENIPNEKYLICDTDLITMKIWSLVVFGKCDNWIKNQVEKSRDKVYLLCYPDLKWEADPLRENPVDRKRLFELYEGELHRLGLPYFIITGKESVRLSKAKKIVQDIIN